MSDKTKKLSFQEKMRLRTYNKPMPTGKPHVSFSEVKEWVDCPWAHKLSHIDKLKTFNGNVYTAFGTAVHAVCEHYLQTRELQMERAINLIKDEFDRLKIPMKVQWMKKAMLVLKSLPEWLEYQFPNWEYISAEEFLYEEIPDSGHKDVKFKGYVDAIIKCDNALYFIDWKTCGRSGWSNDKKNDFSYQMQLVLYDIFCGQKEKFKQYEHLQKKAAFVLLNRDLDVSTSKPIDIVEVAITEKKKQKSLQIINNMISSCKRGVFPKVKKSELAYNSPCKFCEYNKTEHCP